LIAVASILHTSIDELLIDLDFSDPSVLIQRDLRAQQDGPDLVLFFKFGSHETSYKIRNATVAEFDQMLIILMNGLVRGEKAEAVVDAFLYATQTWPHVNPSDLWYFAIPRAFQDPFNHPAASMDVDQAQSWKRTGGWALERVFMNHYNRSITEHGFRIVIPSRLEKVEYFREVGLGEHGIIDKADLLIIRSDPQGPGTCFGVAHVKASFAERRTDDVPLSQALIAEGFTSPLLTMDCKGSPAAVALNRGELGRSWDGAGDDHRGQKRLDIERDGKFDACFSFNLRTEPTPTNINAVARIFVQSFDVADDADPFLSHIQAGWDRFSK
jgi:hypothetical protein